MQVNQAYEPQKRFEYRFVSVLASHVEGNPSELASDRQTLDDLGTGGWQIRAMVADPRNPAARLIVALQRET